MPRKIVREEAPIRISTIRALRASGGLKAGTPLETASVPVSATDPDAKARRMSSSPSACDAVAPRASPAGGVYVGSVPVTTAQRP